MPYLRAVRSESKKETQVMYIFKFLGDFNMQLVLRTISFKEKNAEQISK